MDDQDPLERDELDARVGRALHELTEPSGALRVEDVLLQGHATTRRAGWRAAIAVATSIVLAVGAVVSVQVLREAARSPAASPRVVSGSAPPTTASGRPTTPVAFDVQAWTDGAWPAVIPGRFGKVESTAYDADPGWTLGYTPAVEGSFTERYVGGPATTTYVAVADPRALAGSTQLIVRGRPLAFSRPYFNSTTGEFWMNRLVGVRDDVSAADELQRDVLFQVDEVLGTTLPEGFEPGLVPFTVTAGQVVVEVPLDVRYDGDVLEAGRYLVREQPGAELRIGEEVVLFLKYAPWYRLDGDRYATMTTLVPAHPLFYAFRVDGDRTSSLSTQGAPGDAWSPTLTQLRGIAGGLERRPDQRLPDARLHTARLTRDSDEEPLPTPAPCPPIRVQGYWSGYDSLDALLAESDLVVVARPTTRAAEIDGRGVDPLVVLENDVLVEQVIGGDPSPGQLVPVERLAARDPACQLVVDGNPPLTIDRPYLMALRHVGDRFVLPEAPLALARVRDGRLDSSRWPELDSLTLEAAAERLPATRLGGVEGLKADLRAAGAAVEQVRTYAGAATPFRGMGVGLCVDGQRVHVWLYDSPQERAADAASIDPDDPRHVGNAIAEWQGRVTFWERDRIIVLDLGGAPATTRLLGSVLGEPLAQDPPGDPGPFDHGC